MAFPEWWQRLSGRPPACDACGGDVDADGGHACGACLAAAGRSSEGAPVLGDVRQRSRAQRGRKESVRQKQLRTLQGFIVQSEGEQVIADHLFKHGVLVQYEPRVGRYRPDFLVPDQRLIIEYYGMKNKGYHERRAKKEAFYASRGYRVISVTRTDLPRIGEILKGLGTTPPGLRAELKRQRDDR